MRRSHTAVIERNRAWSGRFETEPYEAAWASEAVFYVRVMEAENPVPGINARVQISPDGMHWCDEGTEVELPIEPGTSYCRVSRFGGFLRLKGELPADVRLRVIVSLSLKE